MRALWCVWRINGVQIPTVTLMLANGARTVVCAWEDYRRAADRALSVLGDTP